MSNIILYSADSQAQVSELEKLLLSSQQEKHYLLAEISKIKGSIKDYTESHEYLGTIRDLAKEKCRNQERLLDSVTSSAKVLETEFEKSEDQLFQAVRDAQY